MCTPCQRKTRSTASWLCRSRTQLPALVYPAGTAIPSGAINPLSAKDHQLLQAVQQHVAHLRRGTTGLTPMTTPRKFRLLTTQIKAIFVLTTSRTPNSSWFLRISDRKEDGVNYPVIPLPLDSTANGKIRILDQQAALGYTHLFGANKVLDAAPWPFSHQGRQIHPVDRSECLHHSRPARCAGRHRRRIASGVHH